jgi:glycogen(starch) synthase
MLGWELPPFNSGGLGTASLGLTEGLSPLNVDIDFVLPSSPGPFPFEHMRIHSAADYGIEGESSAWEEHLFQHSVGYGNHLAMQADGSMAVVPDSAQKSSTLPQQPGPDRHTAWYATRAARLASTRHFDLIHTHDWMTFRAGIAARDIAQKRGETIPFIAHIHATEADRGGSTGGNKAIAALEYEGMQEADRVVAVSQYTKNIVHREYDIPLSKISVVHNGINAGRQPKRFPLHALKAHHKLVLFMGRITMSKGPDYFLEVARQVTQRDPTVRFLMVGSGDMEKACIERAAAMGLTGKVLFSSFLRGEDVDRAYQMADLFIMPSVSEPFGLVALEAMQNGTPVIASKQSGVVEVSPNLIKVDFWDSNAMSASVLSVLNHPQEARALVHGGLQDVLHLSWQRAAERLHEIYQELLPRPLVLEPVPVEA